ncbi:MAG: NADH-quinone oxidoreductase subunit G, partial [Wolinella succinogenes]|uniref:NADH-quinone oxidoreductase subunit G n=1 Tax=Wolinella succinogenes TaxID=844 RepID=UPI0016AE2419
MSEITLWIDEREVRCEEGEYLLQVARARGIFIPAICYLSRCSPTLACKLCMVEADGKRVYACNAKTKEGMRVYTKTPEILEERRAIMQVYDINHPLECGVCDKSGECELQNYTLEMGVYTQDYSIRDSSKEKATWGQALYDPNLCIVCERCVTVCKDMVGSANLKTIKRDADAPAKELKDSMPKDAYGVWNKMSKSLIGHVGEEDCTDCGECISVCPVGALSTKHFHYKSNAWELETTWSACAHCAVGCMVGYETKQGKIYRVTNDWNFGNLCGAGRFGFDFAPPSLGQEREQLHEALEAFKKADTIAFSSYITNEEALILQKLKEAHGYRLYNPEAKRFGDFLRAFSQTAGTLYEGKRSEVSASDFILTLGGSIRHEAPVVKYAINNALKMNKGSSLLCLHPLKDKAMENLGKNVTSLSYAPLKEEQAVAWLLQAALPREILRGSFLEYLEGKERWTSVEIPAANEGEEPTKGERYESLLASALGWEFDLRTSLTQASSPILVIGADLYAHPRATNIARMLGILQKHSAIKILLTP